MRVQGYNVDYQIIINTISGYKQGTKINERRSVTSTNISMALE